MKLTSIYKGQLLIQSRCAVSRISVFVAIETLFLTTLTVSNKGNFLAILQLTASNDSLLQTHLDSCPRNASYTLKTIQNEITDILLVIKFVPA